MATPEKTSILSREERIQSKDKLRDDHILRLLKICMINMFFVGTILKCKNEGESHNYFENPMVKMFFYLFLGSLQVCFSIIFTFVSTFGAPRGIAGIKGLTNLVILGHCACSFFLNVLLTLRMNIGAEQKKDGAEDPSAFSWFAVFCFVLSMATLLRVSTYEFPSPNNGWFQLLPTTHTLDENDEIQPYETDETRHLQHIAKRNLRA